MNIESVILALVILIAVMPPAVAIVAIGHAVIKALSRNPSAASSYFLGMIVTLVFIEVLSISAIIFIYQLFKG